MGCYCSKQEAKIRQKFFENELVKLEIWRSRLIHHSNGGIFQYRGEGSLVLSKSKLWFSGICPWAGTKEFEIPLSEILDVRTRNGIFCHTDLCVDSTEQIVIEFTDLTTSKADSLRIAVEDAQGWKEAIEDCKSNIRKYEMPW